MTPCGHRAIGQASLSIRNNQVSLKLHRATQSGAFRTGPLRRIEAEQLGRQFVDPVIRMVRTTQHRAERALDPRVRRCFLRDNHPSRTQSNRQFHALRSPGRGRFLEHQPVDNHIDRMLAVRGQRSLLFQHDDFAVDARANKSLLGQTGQQSFMASALSAYQRGHHQRATTFRTV